MTKTTPEIVAMIATYKQREKLLLDRALPSVFSQVLRPDKLVVIEDNTKRRPPKFLNCRLIQAVPDQIILHHLRNHRTQGLSGSLNVGINHLAKNSDPSSVYVSFLDDDDEWLPGHLAAVEACIRNGAKVVATPFRRVEQEKKDKLIHPPASITPEIFMEGNPGIQGSNLTVRLDTLLLAGGFNEALKSCTDRDLMLNICDLPEVNYTTTSEPSVKHYACLDRNRLSQPGSVEKLEGLQMFDLIHGPLMSSKTREHFLARSEKLFGWLPESSNLPIRRRAEQQDTPPEADTPPLVVGIIVDHGRIDSVSKLLADLADLVAAEGLLPPDVLLLENRPASASSETFNDMVALHRKQIRIRVVCRDELDSLVESGEWSPSGSCTRGRLAISDARTLLQSFLYHMALERPGCVVWILDDDMRLDPLVSTENGSQFSSLQLGKALRRMKASGADVCIGEYTGAPPLPAEACVAGQTLDVLWNLRVLSTLHPDDPVPVSEPRNSSFRAGCRDYFYDLSRVETNRQATPFAIEPEFPGETVKEAIDRLGDMIPRILAGNAPMRPLLADMIQMEEFKTGNCLHRGGNTFFFNPETLAEMPNISPIVEGRPTRRSDMIGVLLLDRHCNRKVLSVPVPVRQDRGYMSPPEKLDIEKIIDDIRGYAIFSAMEEAGRNRKEILRLCEKYEMERLAALRWSFYRVIGLAQKIVKWCREKAPTHMPRKKLAKQAEKLLELFSLDVFDKIRTEVGKLDPEEVDKFIGGIETRIAKHSEWVRGSLGIPRLLEEQRIAAARVAIEATIQPEVPIHVLGYGREGVVTTNGTTVWKLFDGWTPEQEAHAVPQLKDLTRNLDLGASLVRPNSMTRTPAGWLLAMPFEFTEEWNGGHGPGIVELLADLHKASLIYRNLHPKNLRVAGDGVRLIDYGSALRPIDDPNATSLEFHRMCRRAWLCWRWWWHDDLDDLMHRSLTEPDMPELSGHEALIQAVQERLGMGEPPDPTWTRALALQPTRALDYGAGKGKVAVALAKAGSEVVVWDPNPDCACGSEALAVDGVQRVGSVTDAIKSGPYELVVFRRVACLLDNGELEKAIDDLRIAVASKGRVLFALCHPSYAHRVRVAQADPVPKPVANFPPECRDRGATMWKKQLRLNGRILNEYHRSERLLRRRLARAGLGIVGRHERFRTEFNRFETVADILVLELAPIPLPQVSLLVKACAMDAEALEIHVRDMLTALEGPSVFHEVVLTLDTKTKGFLREHTSGDLDALREAAKRLLNEGEVDMIIETPSDPDELRSLNRRWFGLDLPASHSALPSATGALLAGFDACTAARVLHTDIDMMVGRVDRGRDPIAELTEVLDVHPEAVTASFPVARTTPRPWTSEGPDGPWSVEGRLGMIDMARMEAMLPLPNREIGGVPELSWHRSMYEAVCKGPYESLRGGDGRSFCVHPQNAHKHDLDAWEEIRATIARGIAPAVQHEKIEWDGDPADWRIPERHEHFVFVMCGRNVTPERFRRCWESVVRQKRDDWGAIVIDDASKPWIAEEIGWILAPYAERVTYIARKRRAGLLANTTYAIRHLCTSPEQVIVTLDSDDHLIGNQVLDQLAEQYDRGADLTVGSMLRTDKHSDYPVNLENPRGSYGGNVWQHLRSFEKRLFDELSDELLRFAGDYIELASDWAFMLPMVEAARHPVWIPHPLYMHEPGEDRTCDRAAIRNKVIAHILAMGNPRKDAAE